MSNKWSYKSTSDDENILSIHCKILESFPPIYLWEINMKNNKTINLYKYKDNLDLFTEIDLETINMALANAKSNINKNL